ncbi:hypothetical protein BD311DRAFT_697252, partial [Dichomitus squalens]
MPRRKKAQLAAAARAQAGLARAHQAPQMQAQARIPSVEPLSEDAIASAPSHDPFEDPDVPEYPRNLPVVNPPAEEGFPGDAGRGDQSGEESVEELKGDELLKNLENEAQSAYGRLTGLKSSQQWTQAENKIRGVRTGIASRTLRDNRQKAHTKEMTDAVIRDSYEARHFRAHFTRETPGTAEVLAVSLSEQAHLAGAMARQASDADFVRAQIPRGITCSACKGWTFAPPGVNAAAQGTLPARAREAIVWAVAAASHDSDTAFLNSTSTPGVRDELVGALNEPSAVPMGGEQVFRDVQHAWLASGSAPSRQLKRDALSARLDGGPDRVRARQSQDGAVERGREERRDEESGLPLRNRGRDEHRGLNGGLDCVELSQVRRDSAERDSIERDREDGGLDRVELRLSRQNAVERGGEDGGRGTPPGADLDFDGYLTDLSEDVEDALPEGMRQEQDDWYEDQSIPVAPHGVPPLPALP